VTDRSLLPVLVMSLLGCKDAFTHLANYADSWGGVGNTEASWLLSRNSMIPLLKKIASPIIRLWEYCAPKSYWEKIDDETDRLNAARSVRHPLPNTPLN
jgi:hypothetical protein